MVPAFATVITSEPEKVIEVFVSPSPAILSNCMLPAFVIAESLKSIVPVTSKFPPIETLPVTVKLSATVVSEVVCPIVTGTPEVPVPIVIPFEVLEVSILNDVVASNEIVAPSTVSVPSISVLSKLVVPSTSRSPARSIPAAPAKTKSSVDVSQSI